MSNANIELRGILRNWGGGVYTLSLTCSLKINLAELDPVI